MNSIHFKIVNTLYLQILILCVIESVVQFLKLFISYFRNFRLEMTIFISL